MFLYLFNNYIQMIFLFNQIEIHKWHRIWNKNEYKTKYSKTLFKSWNYKTSKVIYLCKKNQLSKSSFCCDKNRVLPQHTYGYMVVMSHWIDGNRELQRWT